MSVVDIVGAVCARDVSQLSHQEVRASLADLAQVQGWVESVRIAHVRRLEQLAAESPIVRPELDVAAAGRETRRQAADTCRRATTLDAAPAMEAALGAGEVSTAHVDALGRAFGRLDGDQRDVLATEQERLTRLARRCTPEQFERHLGDEVRLLQGDGGVGELERQKRANRLRMRPDVRTGMYRISGELDPESGLALQGRLDNAMRTLFATRQPDTCPTDPLEKLDHLRALALLRLTDRRGVSTEPDDITLVGANVEITVVVDWETLAAGQHCAGDIDLGHPDVTLPIATIHRMACLADIIPVVLGSDGVPLKLGRTTRLANRHQRRALRALYKTCAVSGCKVLSRYCEPHHVVWWRHNGLTDLSNLAPLCSLHHHAVHEGGWHLELLSDRTLVITYPDGRVERCPLPRRPAGTRRSSASGGGRAGSPAMAGLPASTRPPP